MYYLFIVDIFFISSCFLFFSFFLLLQILHYSEMFPWTNTEWQQMVVKSTFSLTCEIQTCTAYTTYIWTEFRLFHDLRRSTCVCVLLRSSVSHLSRMLLLWSFKAKREYNGMQRQRNMTSTQGQPLVFAFSLWPSSFCLRSGNGCAALRAWGRVLMKTGDHKAEKRWESWENLENR